MSWVITGAEKTPVDKLGIQNVSLLLHGNGTNGSTTIVDSSPSPKTVTAFGNAQISTTIADPFGNSTGVIAFDGAGDYLTFAQFLLINDFTLEAWVRLNVSNGDGYLASSATGNDQLIRFQSLNISVFVDSVYGGSGGQVISPVSSGMSAEVWSHVALCRAAGTTRLFVDGIVKSTNTTWTGRVPISNIGRAGIFNSNFLNGYVDDLRISSVARYTANFTPPTAPFPDI